MARRIDWFSPKKELRHAMANKTVQYLNLPGIRERLGLGGLFAIDMNALPLDLHFEI